MAFQAATFNPYISQRWQQKETVGITTRTHGGGGKVVARNAGQRVGGAAAEKQLSHQGSKGATVV